MLVIGGVLSDIREQARMAEEQIHTIVEHQITLLRDRETALLNEVESTKSQKEKELHLQKEELEFLLGGIRQAVSFGEAMVKEGSESEIVAGHQQVMSRLTTLTPRSERGCK